jgi:acetolactate decarboxylase
MENDSIHSMTDTITQVSVLSALLARQFDGYLPCRELLKYGDFGIGTFDRMEGEMIVVDGNIYQGKADGKVYAPDLDNRTPFATVCHFRPDLTWTVSDTANREAMERMFDEKASNQNVFCAIRVEGAFSYVETHALRIQSKPYPSTAEVVKSVVHSEMQDVSGTIVGFRSPPYVRGIGDPGYHLHFLSDDKTQGGHVLTFDMDRGECAIDICSNHLVILPDDGAALAGIDLSKDLVKEFEEALSDG